MMQIYDQKLLPKKIYFREIPNIFDYFHMRWLGQILKWGLKCRVPVVLEARNEEDLEDEDDLPDLLSSDSDEESSGDE